MATKLQPKALLFVLIITLCSACEKSIRQTIENPDRYTEQAAMSVYIQEPERALALLDTAVLVGNISDERADYLRACVYYSGLNDAVTAKHLSLQLINNPQLDDELAEDVYALLASIAHSAGDDNGVMQYAPMAHQLAEELGRYGDAGQLKAYIAFALSHQGQTDEAVQTIQAVLDELRERHTWDCMVAYMSAAKSMLHLLYETDRIADMPAACERVLQQLQYFEDNQHLYTDMPKGFTPDEFLDMSRAQIYSLLCGAQAHLGNRRAALEAEQKALSTNYGKHGRADKILQTAWLALGEWDKFDAAIESLDNSQKSDTINRNHYITLKNRSLAAERRGRTADALHYERRAAAIQDSLNAIYIQQRIAEQTTLYNLQQTTIAKERAEERAHRTAALLIIAIFIILLTIAWAAYFFVTRRHIHEKNRALVRLINAQQLNAQQLNAQQTPQTEEKTTTIDDTKEDYTRLCNLVIKNKLYTDITLDRQRVTGELGISRKALNDILHVHANGQSFPQWLNDIRITEACRLLHDNPDLPINDIAAAVGLTSQNLRLLFRQRYGITPTEYRQNK